MVLTYPISVGSWRSPMDLTRLVPLRRRQWYRPDGVWRLQEMQRRMIRHLQEETPQKKTSGLVGG